MRATPLHAAWKGTVRKMNKREKERVGGANEILIRLEMHQKGQRWSAELKMGLLQLRNYA